MIYKIICLVAMVSNIPLMVFFQDKVLTLDSSKTSVAQRYLLFTAFALPMDIAKIFMMDSLWYVAGYGIHIIGTVWMLRCCYQEAMLNKIIVWIIFMGLSIVGDGIVELLFLITGEMLSSDYSQPIIAFGCVMVLPIVLILYIFFARIWNKAYKKQQPSGNTGFLLLFSILPVFIVVIGILTVFSAGNDSISTYMFLCGTFSFMSILMLLMLLLHNDRVAVQQKLMEFQCQSELERAHYAAVEEKREALARIRHDYRNVLTSILILMEGENQERAKELLTELTERISVTSETPFCSIPMINAVLTEKQALCNKQGVFLRPELLLPEVLSVSDFDLCSILCNLIDNAIRACGRENMERAPEASPEIRLSADVVQGYLVIRCENLVFPGVEEKHGTGYGQKILKSLADKYKGDFFAERQDGQYTAQISLFLEKR